MYELFAFIFQNSFLLRGIILFVFGLIIGSFLNVVIYRLPIMLLQQWQKEDNQLSDISKPLQEVTHMSLISPNSHCVICKSPIPFWANIPLLGYFIVNGRCINCHGKISMCYPFVELITGILFVIAGYISNDIIILPSILTFISIVLCLIIIDFNNLMLPDELTLSLLWIGLLVNTSTTISGGLVNAVVGAAIAYSSLWLLYWVFKYITKREGLGYGDFKFSAAILAWIGYQGLIPLYLISSILGIIYYIVIRLSGRAQNTSSKEIPFGTFLGIAGLFLLLGNNYISLSMFML